MSFARIRQILIKEFIQVFRDPRMKGIIFAIPVIQLLVFGYAVTTDVRHVEIAVRDLDNSSESRDFLSRFSHSTYFDVVARPESDERARELIDQGKVRAVIHIHHGFGAALRAGHSAPAQLIVDGSDSNTARIVLDYSIRIAAQFSQQVLLERLDRLGAQAPRPGGARLETRTWFNENLESRNYFVPGVIAMLVMLITLMLTSMAIVREKEIGTMEQVMVTPIRPMEFILGKTLPFAIIAFMDVALITGVGVLWFDVPIRGNPLLLIGCTAIYLMTTLGIGLFISTVSHTQQQAMMTTFFFFFPAMLLSGFIFPIANMPEVIQTVTYINPLRHFLIILRGIFLKGVDFTILWPQMLALFVMGIVTLTLASLRFRKRMG